jgi:peptidoglycan L-alanyl-D-glutamate endopeptidase CwlK
MTITLSTNSIRLLKDAHPQLERLAVAVAAGGVAFRVICSYRGKIDQERAFASGVSKARWLQSPHNYKPSAAIDIAPGVKGPIDWRDLRAFELIGWEFARQGKLLEIPIRLGQDWNGNGKIDERFVDRPHIELHPWRAFIPNPKG